MNRAHRHCGDDYETKKEKLLRLAKQRTIPVRMMARKLRCRQEEVIEMVEDLSGFGEQIEIIVGMRVGGLGGGVFVHEKIGDYEVDYYG